MLLILMLFFVIFIICDLIVFLGEMFLCNVCKCGGKKGIDIISLILVYFGCLNMYSKKSFKGILYSIVSCIEIK